MRIHVFTSDVLPLPNLPTSGGGLRCWQLIKGLEERGHEVTYSMSIFTFLGKKYAGSIPQGEKDKAWTFHNQYALLKRFQPDVAIWGSPTIYFLPEGFKPTCACIADLNGPLNLEQYLYWGDMHGTLKQRSEMLCANLEKFDYFITVSERQRYYWMAYLFASGIPHDEIRMDIVPFGIDPPDIPREIPDELTLVSGGGFHPWQDPSLPLLTAGRVLDGMGRGRLEFYGGYHEGECRPRDKERYDRLLGELGGMSSVRLHGFMSYDELSARYAKASAALDLIKKNHERELAYTTRTIQFLALGIPVIYNDYATLSDPIREHGAGWCVDPDDADALAALVRRLADSPDEIREKSANARTLAEGPLNPSKLIEPLARFCAEPAARASRIPKKERGKPGARPRWRVKPFRPRVLAISPDWNNAITALRIVMPLQSMKVQGLIEGYNVVCHDGGIVMGPDHYDRYDVIWLQRNINDGLVQIVRNHIGRFMFDIDDLMIVHACYHSGPLGDINSLTSMMRDCTSLSVSNGRLLGNLEKLTGLPLAHKAYTTPNAMNFPLGAKIEPRRPDRMVWTSSDYAALTTSTEHILSALGDFSKKYNLPIYNIGLFKKELQKKVPSMRTMGFMNFWQHKELLASMNTMIGVAPLETEADDNTLTFISCKSDLKMVEYGGYGHPAVYSRMDPYTDTDLKAGAVAGNTYKEWMESLEYLYREGYKRAADEANEIREKRHIHRVTRDHWMPALEAALLYKPVALEFIQEKFRNAEWAPLPEPPVPAMTNVRLPDEEEGIELRDVQPPVAVKSNNGENVKPEPVYLEHHLLADRIYYDFYCRVFPVWARSRVGPFLARFIKKTKAE